MVKMNGGKMTQSRKIGNTRNMRYENYLKQFLEESDTLRGYEIPVVIRAFSQTLKYFLFNGIEFVIKGFCSYKRFSKKDSKMYIRYLNEYITIPAHEDAKIVVDNQLKDYLNKRGKFKNVSHRETLPDGTKRKKGLWDND